MYRLPVAHSLARSGRNCISRMTHLTLIQAGFERSRPEALDPQPAYTSSRGISLRVHASRLQIPRNVEGRSTATPAIRTEMTEAPYKGDAGVSKVFPRYIDVGIYWQHNVLDILEDAWNPRVTASVRYWNKVATVRHRNSVRLRV